MHTVTRVLRESIEFSLANREKSVEYALGFGRGLNHDLADEFVGMYVNHWTIDYGDRGREAIRRFLRQGAEAGYVGAAPELEFVTA